MNERSTAGVVVKALIDKTQAAGPSDQVQLSRLVASIEKHITSSPTGAIDHEKVMIRDRSSVWFGSYNFSISAQSQRNYAFLSDDPDVVAAFVADWEDSYAWAVAHPETAGNVSLCPTCGNPLGDETETE
jgi:phosphatidylserine/phosphatidylglycerophosphate/cardiolipin synthase-like enzyme